MQFKTTKDNAEEQFVDSLQKHYEECKRDLTGAMDTIRQVEEVVIRTAPEEQVEEYHQMMAKTRANVTRAEERLRLKG